MKEIRVVGVCRPPFRKQSGLAQLSWNSKNSSPGNQLLTIQFTLPLTLQLPCLMLVFFFFFAVVISVLFIIRVKLLLKVRQCVNNRFYYVYKTNKQTIERAHCKMFKHFK